MNLKNGFTLIELLITILVFTILAMLAVPTFHHVMSRVESMRVEHQIKELLLHSRNTAFSLHQRIAICGSQDGVRCIDNRNWTDGILLYNDNVIRNRILDQGENKFYYHKLNLDYGTLEWRGFGVAGNILFQDDRGIPLGSNGSFFYCNPDNPQLNKRIVMSSAGNIRVEKAVKC
ncbi:MULTISPECIES: Tfp pilus assembly protein FimT/FimU [unclassified Acinetobacter]|uniref:pilus assembly FimT family protein n=1 Tax=unclassified Acinetobacter TaxID=196816 RepID=UPI0035B8B5CD